MPPNFPASIIVCKGSGSGDLRRSARHAEICSCMCACWRRVFPSSVMWRPKYLTAVSAVTPWSHTLRRCLTKNTPCPSPSCVRGRKPVSLVV